MLHNMTWVMFDKGFYEYYFERHQTAKGLGKSIIRYEKMNKFLLASIVSVSSAAVMIEINRRTENERLRKEFALLKPIVSNPRDSDEFERALAEHLSCILLQLDVAEKFKAIAPEQSDLAVSRVRVVAKTAMKLVRQRLSRRRAPLKLQEIDALDLSAQQRVKLPVV